MCSVERGLPCAVTVRVQVHVVVAADGGGEGGEQAVVIAGRNRIVLVIVAAHAADGEAEHRGEGGREHVVQLIVPLLLNLVLRDLRGVGAGGQEAGGRERHRV